AAPDFSTELRREIFAARLGECFTPGRLLNLYQGGATGVPRSALSHLVSCPRCLDEANRLLDLPLLQERSAMDVLGIEPDNTKV
ncbi:MAG: hypothetical protein ACRD9R_24555, partial [Pyrinomonadaceae bacterium]